VSEEVAKIVQQLVDEFETCLTYLCGSPDDDISLPDTGDRSSPRWPVGRSQTREGKPADSQIVKIIISELCAFLRIPTESVQEEHSLLSFGLDSLKAAALSRSLRERGIYISPVDIIQASSIRGAASVSVKERNEESSTSEGDSELDKLLKRDLPVESVKLGKDDQVKITAATALQAGMISQVTPLLFCGYTRYSLTFCYRPLFPRDNFMCMPSHSNSGSHVKLSD
jgi:aryl carrier-like protein